MTIKPAGAEEAANLSDNGNKANRKTDEEMKISMKFMFEHYKLALEPACVAGIAALAGSLKGRLLNQKTLVILCGSNIDFDTWHNLVEKK